MNPDEFDIETKKLVGLWPDTSSLSYSLVPYIKRMKTKVSVTLFGDIRGQNAFDIFDRVDKKKIKRINLLGASKTLDPKLLDLNISSKIKGHSVGDDEVVGFIGTEFTEENFKKGYQLLKKGGIIAGDNHDKPEVKDLLFKLRREMRIGTPINVANLSVWFWIKA